MYSYCYFLQIHYIKCMQSENYSIDLNIAMIVIQCIPLNCRNKMCNQQKYRNPWKIRFFFPFQKLKYFQTQSFDFLLQISINAKIFAFFIDFFKMIQFLNFCQFTRTIDLSDIFWCKWIHITLTFNVSNSMQMNNIWK